VRNGYLLRKVLGKASEIRKFYLESVDRWQDNRKKIEQFIYIGFRAARFFLVQTYQNGKNIPNDHKLYQTAINYTKWPQNIPNGHKIYKHFSF
jgi:TPR repeat protein